MTIKDIVCIITDIKLNIEIKEKKSGASFGFYDKRYVPTELLTKEVKGVNVQYVDSKRLLIIEF